MDATKGNEVSGSSATSGGNPPRTKRRRSTTNPASSQSTPKSDPPDVWALEEIEAESRNPDKDQQLFRQACGNVRRIMKEILELKKQKNSGGEIAEKRIQASLLFLTMKKLNRLEKIRNRKVKDATNEAKLKVDMHHLQLQNLLYEVSHLTKEINKCLDFKSNDEEIELVSLDEFYKEASSDISKPERTKNDVHEQTLARLDWELEQRKRLSVKCSEAEKQKENILKELANKKESLDALAPGLAAILQATMPVQEQLGGMQSMKHRQNRMAAYLPTPLFILYAQSNAYAYAWGKKIKVTVEGDIEEAKALKDSTEEQDEDSGDSDQEEYVGEKRYRRKTTDKVTEARRNILRKHPLHVALVFSTKDGSQLKLCFSYLVLLHVVTVSIHLILPPDLRMPSRNVLNESILLDFLFPNDDGHDTPNKANYYQLKRLGMDDFRVYVSELGRPYVWAQRLAGLDFIQESESSPSTSRITTVTTAKPETSSSHMETVVRAIKRRLNSRVSLQKQLLDLEQGVVSIPSESMQLFPAKIITHLVSWTNLIWDDYCGYAQTQQFVNAGLVTENHFLFCAAFERGSAKLVALVAISPHYPIETPIFALDVVWKRNKLVSPQESTSALREMEMEVNLYWEELVMTDSSAWLDEDRLLSSRHRLLMLLSAQMQRLALCFDVFLETVVADSVCDGKQDVSNEFLSDKVFFGAKKFGRSRRRPFKYIPQAGFFTHR